MMKPVTCLGLYCFFLLVGISQISAKWTIHIGAIFRIHRFDHLGYKTAVNFAVDLVNKRNDILKDYEIKIHFCDTWNDVGFALRCLYDLVNMPPTKIMLLGPETSKMLIPVASAADLWNLVQISSAAYDANFEGASHFRLQFLTRNVPDFVELNEARLHLMKHFRWQRTALLYEYDEPTTSEIVEDLKIRLSRAGIELVTVGGFGKYDNQTLVTQIDKLIQLKVRVIIGDFGVRSLRTLFCLVFQRQLDISKYVWILLDRYDPNWATAKTQDIPCTKEMLIQASQGFFAVKRMLLRKDDIVTVANLTASEYQTGYNRRARLGGKRAELWDVPAVLFDGVWAAALALNKSLYMNLTDFTYEDFQRATILNKNLRNLSFEGVTGPHKFNKKNSLLGCVGVSQQRAGKLVDIAKFCQEEERLSFHNKSLYDIFKDGKVPRDRVRTLLEVSKYKLATTITLFVMCCMGILVALFFFYINFKYKKERCIQASSPRLNILILSGGIVMYLSSILSALDTQYVALEAYPTICTLQTWLMCCGFTLTFGAMFSKTWRVYKIFTASKSLRRIGNVTDRRLISIVLAFLCVDIIIMTTWTIISPYEVKQTDFLPQEVPLLDLVIVPRVFSCQCRYQDTFILSVYAYKGVVLIFGLFLAWETRNVHIKDLNDSKYIGMSVYNVVVFAAIGAMSSRLLEKSKHYELTFLIQSLSMLLCTTAVLFCLYIPKILVIRNLDKNSPWLVSRTTVCTFVSENNSTARPLYIATDVVDRGTQTKREVDEQSEPPSPPWGRVQVKLPEKDTDPTRRLNLLVIEQDANCNVFAKKRASICSALDTEICIEDRSELMMEPPEESSAGQCLIEKSSRALYAVNNGNRRPSASFILDSGHPPPHHYVTFTKDQPHPLTANALIKRQWSRTFGRRAARRHSYFIINGSSLCTSRNSNRRSSSPNVMVNVIDPCGLPLIHQDSISTGSNGGSCTKERAPDGELQVEYERLNGISNNGYDSSGRNSVKSRAKESPKPLEFMHGKVINGKAYSSSMLTPVPNLDPRMGNHPRQRSSNGN